MKREREREREPDRGRALEWGLNVWSTGVIGMRDMSSVFPMLTVNIKCLLWTCRFNVFSVGGKKKPFVEARICML